MTDPSIGGVIVTWIEPNITDNSGAFRVNSSAIPGETFGFGITLVTYVAKDSAGNEEYCDFFVIVNGKYCEQFFFAIA